jgi:hypothetical protein
LARRAQLQGKCKNLVRVDRVIQVPIRSWRSCNDYQYIIIAERLQPIPPEAYKFLPNYQSDICIQSDDMMDAARRVAAGEIVQPDWRAVPTVWGIAACNIKGMLDDLRSLGVTCWEDFKLTNVLLRPGDRIVVSDFGCTQSPTPEIEEFKLTETERNLPSEQREEPEHVWTIE